MPDITAAELANLPTDNPDRFAEITSEVFEGIPIPIAYANLRYLEERIVAALRTVAADAAREATAAERERCDKVIVAEKTKSLGNRSSIAGKINYGMGGAAVDSFCSRILAAIRDGQPTQTDVRDRCDLCGSNGGGCSSCKNWLLPPAPPESAWMPIATAPKDGTEILVVDKGSAVHKVAWLDDSTSLRGNKMMCWCVPGSWQDEQGGYFTIGNPTHWMPLPPAPREEPKT